MIARRGRAIADDYGWVLPRLRRPVRRLPDPWAEGSRAPVLLIAGVYEPWSFLIDLGTAISDAGHPVHVVPAIGLNRRPITEGARHVLEYLAQLDLHGVQIVAHSKGGLVGKQAMVLDEAGRIDRMVAIATPFSGSDRARYLPTRTLRDLAPRAVELAALSGRRDVDARITSIFGTWDPHIPNGSALEGARNIQLPLTGHFRMLSDELVLSTVLKELGMQ